MAPQRPYFCEAIYFPPYLRLKTSLVGPLFFMRCINGKGIQSKVIIPGDKVGEYLKPLEKAEKARENFRQYLKGLNEEFTDYLMSKFSQRTVRKHAGIVEMFIEFLCGQTDVDKIEEITKGMANTYFRQWHKRKVWDSSTPNDLKIALRRFFQSLSERKGIKNEKVLQSPG